MKKSLQIKPWKVKNARYIIKNRWITVRADTCATAEGVVIAPYYILEYPDWVHMVVVDRNNKILITRQYRHGAQQIVAELPCGTVDPRDKTPRASAKRELMEETGYTGNFALVGVTSPNPATHTNSIYTYVVTHPIQRNIPVHNPYEVMSYEFVEMKEILRLIENKEFTQALHISDLFLALRKVGIKLPAR